MSLYGDIIRHTRPHLARSSAKTSVEVFRESDGRRPASSFSILPRPMNLAHPPPGTPVKLPHPPTPQPKLTNPHGLKPQKHPPHLPLPATLYPVPPFLKRHPVLHSQATSLKTCSFNTGSEFGPQGTQTGIKRLNRTIRPEPDKSMQAIGCVGFSESKLTTHHMQGQINSWPVSLIGCLPGSPVRDPSRPPCEYSNPVPWRHMSFHE